VVLEKESQ